MMHRLLFIFALIPALVMAEPPFEGKPGHGRGEHGSMDQMHRPKDRKERFFHQIDLTEQQRMQIKKMMEKSRESMRERIKTERRLKQELRQLTMSADYQAGEANNLIQQIIKLRQETLEQLVATDRQIFNLLTDEQKQKLTAVK